MEKMYYLPAIRYNMPKNRKHCIAIQIIQFWQAGNTNFDKGLQPLAGTNHLDVQCPYANSRTRLRHKKHWCCDF